MLGGREREREGIKKVKKKERNGFVA